MNKLNYGTFDISNGDIAFASTNGYSNPSSELETRKQLSYPLKEVKTFVNNTVSVDSDDNAVQIVLDDGRVKYRSEAGGNLSAVTVKIFSGTTDPSASLGEDGDIYIKYE